jgi:hypothetical protein
MAISAAVLIVIIALTIAVPRTIVSSPRRTEVATRSRRNTCTASKPPPRIITCDPATMSNTSTISGKNPAAPV